ncbi:hypothetical protein FDP41_002811 [Naegleria fowleri]|uniref:Aspartyl/asparaginy/proline hydroxylase domain-containing protein n=1 Tax=Naegleria fowleri TaxID=5763 RepID=A0A6A5BSZ0_NAEFO|nr:uncharacterized protein FDP41_002811 [Naegleria fowleri]KAF0978296.1 hypothetical protein FDP41_002811 [Naegleria fowleri]CAG4716187.1 unnamed protein product [Naegleria fowleri]
MINHKGLVTQEFSNTTSPTAPSEEETALPPNNQSSSSLPSSSLNTKSFTPSSIQVLNHTKRIMIQELISIYEFNEQVLLEMMKAIMRENDDDEKEISFELSNRLLLMNDVSLNTLNGATDNNTITETTATTTTTTTTTTHTTHQRDTPSLIHQLEDYLIEYAPLRLIYCLYQFLIKGNRLHQPLRYPNLFVYPQIGSDEPYYDPHYIYDFIHQDEHDDHTMNHTSLETYNYSIFRNISLDLESNFEMIRNEFIQVYTHHFNDNIIMDRIQSSVDGQWNAIYLVNQGKLDVESIVKFPKTFNLLDSILGFEEGRICRLNIGYVYFSIIHEGTHILPHCGVSNIKLRIQLPLIVPNQTRVTMKVKNIERQYKEGQTMILDDSFVHEVKYESSSPTSSSQDAKSLQTETIHHKVTASSPIHTSPTETPTTTTTTNHTNHTTTTTTNNHTTHTTHTTTNNHTTTTTTPSLDSIRVVLLIDIYHSDLTRDEIQLLHLFFDHL